MNEEGMDGGLRVKIRWDDFSDNLSFLFYKEGFDGRRYVVSPVKFQLVESGPGVPVEPTLSIPGNLGKDFLKNIASLLDEEGIKTDNDFKLQGQIDSMKLHLEDMRKIVFKNLDIK